MAQNDIRVIFALRHSPKGEGIKIPNPKLVLSPSIESILSTAEGLRINSAEGSKLKRKFFCRLTPHPSRWHSFDHLHRPVEHLGRDRYADLIGGLEIERKIELCWLHQSKITRLGAFQNLIDVFSRAPG